MGSFLRLVGCGGGNDERGEGTTGVRSVELGVAAVEAQRRVPLDQPLAYCVPSTAMITAANALSGAVT